MSTNKLSLERIDKIRNAIWTLQHEGIMDEEEDQYYVGWVDALTWIRSILYPSGTQEAQK